MLRNSLSKIRISRWDKVRNCCYNQQNYKSVAVDASKDSRTDVRDFAVDPNYLHITWMDNIKSTYHLRWLRNYCPCPLCKHPDSGQKLISPSEIPKGIQLSGSPSIDESEAKLYVDWLDNGREIHRCSYDLEWLKKYTPKNEIENPPAILSTTWGTPLDKIPTVNYNNYMENDEELYDSLHQLQSLGVLLLRHCPQKEGIVNKIAERIGPIRNTFYGYTWKVENVSGAENLASTNLPIPFHQDLLYFVNPPYIQFLHAIVTAEGGRNELVDGFDIAKTLKKTNRKAFDILSTVPMSYHFESHTDRREYSHTIIELSKKNPEEIVRINYSPPWEGVFKGTHEQVDDFFDAYKAFTDLARDPARATTLHMDPGDCLVFANSRLFHNRSGFSADEYRLLEGTYLDKCDLENKYRILSLQFNKEI